MSEEERTCRECGEPLEDYEEDLCEDCRNNLASAIFNTDEIDNELF